MSNRPSQSTGQSDLRAQLAEGPFEEGAYVRIYCPYHGDTTNPGGAVYEGHFYCFTCGKWEGRFGFLRLLQQRSDISAVSVVSRGTSAGSAVSDALAEGYAKLLWGARKSRISWLLERGLDERTIREAQLGHTGRSFSIPIRKEEVLVGIKYRSDPYYDTCADECTCPKYTNSSGSTANLYGPLGRVETWIRGGAEGHPIALCEGEFDALLLARYGIRSCSLTSGAGSGYESLEPLRGREVVVVYDADKPGQRGALRVRDCLSGGARIATWHAVLDEKGRVQPGWPKDVTDYVQMHGIEKFRRLARI